MKKEGRAIVVVVLLIFFIIAVAVCGYFMIKLDKKEKEMQSIQEELSQIKEELKNKNEEIKEEAKQQKEETSKKEEVSIDVDALNKEHCERILKMMGAGSFEGKYNAIMKKNGEPNYTSDYSKGQFSFKVTDENYSDYERAWKSFISESLFEEIVKYKMATVENAIINVNGKVAINVLMWTGSTMEFVSHKQISKEGNSYTYEVKYKVKVRWDPEEYDNKTAIVTGRVEGSNYIIEKFENK